MWLSVDSEGERRAYSAIGSASNGKVHFGRWRRTKCLRQKARPTPCDTPSFSPLVSCRPHPRIGADASGLLTHTDQPRRLLDPPSSALEGSQATKRALTIPCDLFLRPFLAMARTYAGIFRLVLLISSLLIVGSHSLQITTAQYQVRKTSSFWETSLVCKFRAKPSSPQPLRPALCPSVMWSWFYRLCILWP